MTTSSLIESGKKLENTIDFSRFAKQMARHWWKALLVSLVITGLITPLILKMTPQYLSTATVLLKALPENANPIAPVERFDSYQGEYYATQNKLVGSRRVITLAVLALKLEQNPSFNGEGTPKKRGLIDKIKYQWLHLTPPPPPKRLSDQDKIDHAVRTVSANLTVSAVRLTQLVHITYASPSPSVAAEVANGVAKAYVNLSAQNQITATEKAYQWNKQQMEKLQAKILQQKAGLEQIIKKEGIVPFNGVGSASGIGGFATEQLGIVVNKLADARDEALIAKANYDELNKLLGEPIDALVSLPQISDHPQLENLRLVLVQAERNLVNLQKQYGPQFTRVIQAKAQIQVIKTQWNTVLLNLKRGLSQKYQEALAKEQQYQLLLNKQKSESRKLGVKTDKYNLLKADLQNTEQLYQSLYLKTQQLKVSSAYRESNSELYDAAIPALRPSKPNKPLFVVMVFLLSFIVGVVYIIVRVSLNNTIEDTTQLMPRLGLYPLGELRQFQKNTRHLSSWLHAIAQHRPLVETVYGLRSEFLACEQDWRLFGLASAQAQEGTSLATALMGMAFSQDQKTLVIDLNYRTETGLSSEFKQENKKGFADIIAGKASLLDCVFGVDERFDFLPKGDLTLSPLLLFAMPEVFCCLREWLANYDRILIDLPAVNEYKDAQMVATQLDGLLMVVQANREGTPTLVSAINKLQTHGVTLLGGILNQVKDDNLLSEENRALANSDLSFVLSKNA